MKINPDEKKNLLFSIMIQTKLKCVHSTKVIKGTGYHLDILIAGTENFRFSFIKYISFHLRCINIY